MKRITLIAYLLCCMALIGGCSSELDLSSPAFDDGELIPALYTCDGEGINPPLEISAVPPSAMSFVLIVDDPDAPAGTWDHWIVWDIPIDSSIREAFVPGTPGVNSWGHMEYGGPCPPSGEHRYYFRLYALDSMLDLERGSSRSDLENAMNGHIVASAELMGRYLKQN